MTIRYQGMPLISVPIVEPNGFMNLQWYRFFNSLHIKSGLGPFVPGSTANRIGVVESANRKAGGGELIGGGNNGSIAINLLPSFEHIAVYDVTTGEMIGFINFDGLL